MDPVCRVVSMAAVPDQSCHDLEGQCSSDSSSHADDCDLSLCSVVVLVPDEKAAVALLILFAPLCFCTAAWLHCDRNHLLMSIKMHLGLVQSENKKVNHS